MPTSLNTERIDTGLRLTSKDDQYQGLIAYNGEMAPRPWHVITGGANPERWWSTSEAAEFYALALYADKTEIERLTP